MNRNICLSAFWGILVVFPLGFFSCTTVYFENAQPIGLMIKDKFPKEILGKYIADGDTITIESKRIYWKQYREYQVSVNEVDTSEMVYLKDGLIYNKSFESLGGVPYEIKSDTVFYTIMEMEEKELGKDFFLKEYKDMLFLNEREEDLKYWNTYLLRPVHRDTLSFEIVTNLKTSDGQKPKYSTEESKELAIFSDITEFKMIGEKSYLINPTVEELDLLIERGFFIPMMELVRLKNP